MKEEISCGAVVYRMETNKPLYLVIRHMNGGHWAFAKGHVEANETEEETALREIQEETGLHVELDTNFREVNRYSPGPGITKDVIYFLAQAQTSAIQEQAIEVTDSAWLPFEEAVERLTYANDQAILTKAHHYLQD
ncbi:DNA mismatch repair protein MutT [Suicoccus acidiformans]|uniref:Bis(5'-nucleosyl)-tetraphosphatase [asymmetrical] n=1 Tax=Suicoccus acidiformans TaxID=2036206 RepID=A0A347WL51_9LACT|nr:NUDIX domain-containing protein [Suicoccus acidiformans]AXY25808.1 DNA mismatch repair protein MutT [Suicoccus acidiformans]